LRLESNEFMKIDFEKYADGLVPAVIQDADTNKILMVGFMNRKALKKTEKSGKVTFFSRSRKKLWTKGETSGNFLDVIKIISDCDQDTLLIKAKPTGKICHTGADTCFNEKNKHDDFLFELEKIVLDRKANPKKSSHTSMLFARGLNKIAQKLGEEAVELIIEAKDSDDELFKGEAADLLYHFMVLLAERGISLEETLKTLKRRRR
jgi:phosphoribosyl-AMP cyclohydrolase / phosphoribosyl-ATP pyrophosphohydrolase